MGKTRDSRYDVTTYLPPQIYAIVTTKLKGSLGKTDSEIVRNIIIIYLAERGLLQDGKYLIDEMGREQK